jgi:1-acyl-sn-glycerol-3-phosphate acyltransferase
MNGSEHYADSAAAFALRLVFGANVTSTGSRTEVRQRIYYANHTSHLDFIVLWAALPSSQRRTTRPVAAKDYWSNGWIRGAVAERLFRAVLVDRPESYSLGGQAMLEPLLNAVDEGSSLILFPEGTRGTGERIGTFKSGIYHLCRLRPGLQLLPVYLENLNRILPKGEFLPVPLLSRVVFGSPVELREAEPKDEFLERARAALADLGSA